MNMQKINTHIYIYTFVKENQELDNKLSHRMPET